jgi:hypothetical protein
MTFIPNNEFKQRQSSEEWQDGVRLENRLRKIEGDLADLGRLTGWVIVGYVSGIVILAAIFLFKH